MSWNARWPHSDFIEADFLDSTVGDPICIDCAALAYKPTIEKSAPEIKDETSHGSLLADDRLKSSLIRFHAVAGCFSTSLTSNFVFFAQPKPPKMLLLVSPEKPKL